MPPAWKIGLTYSGIAVVFVLFLVVFPRLRWFPLPSGQFFPVCVLAMGIPVVSTLWAVAAFRFGEHERRVAWFAISLGLSVGSMAVAAFVFWIEIRNM